MPRLALFCLLLPLSALADERYLGSLNASGGASTNNFAVGSTKADGTSGAFTLSGSAQKPLLLLLQCDVAVRYRTGTGGSTAAANTGANKGIKLDADQLKPIELVGTALAVIPSTGSGSATCDVFQRTTK